MFEYNQPYGFEMAKLRQEMMLREYLTMQRERRQAREATAEQETLRKFRLMYRVRHWMHRIVPALARGLF